MKISIVGNGDWGNALLSVIKQNATTVQMLKRGEIVSGQDIVILSVPTQSIREVLKTIEFKGKNRIIINTAKGIEESTHLLPNKIVKDFFKNDIEYYTLIGPSFASEVKKEMPTLVNLGYKRKTQNTLEVKKLLQTKYFRVRLSHGVEVLELSAAFKNVYAIACGLARGMGYELNTRVKLMVLAIEEMRKLFKNLDLKVESDITTGTLGDLILTCSSTESRNYTFGTLLPKLKINEALEKVTTVEGYHSLPSIEHYKKISSTQMPLATLVAEIVNENNPAKVREKFERFVEGT